MEIKVFQNAAFGQIRTMQDEKGEPLFCAKDVAEALGYKNTRDALHKHVERDDVAKRDTIDSIGRTALLCQGCGGGIGVQISTQGRTRPCGERGCSKTEHPYIKRRTGDALHQRKRSLRAHPLVEVAQGTRVQALGHQ